MAESNAERILLLLKTRGPATAAALAKALRITPMGVRQHLAHLADDGLVSRLSRVFGIEPVYFHDIADSTKAALTQASNALTDNLSEKAMEIHLQRIVGSFVGSACGAGEFSAC